MGVNPDAVSADDALATDIAAASRDVSSAPWAKDAWLASKSCSLPGSPAERSVFSHAAARSNSSRATYARRQVSWLAALVRLGRLPRFQVAKSSGVRLRLAAHSCGDSRGVGLFAAPRSLLACAVAGTGPS